MFPLKAMGVSPRITPSLFNQWTEQGKHFPSEVIIKLSKELLVYSQKHIHIKQINLTKYHFLLTINQVFIIIFHLHFPPPPPSCHLNFEL